MEQGSSMKFWAEDDRPREKLLLKGRNALSDAELIAILLRTGMKGTSALDLARSLLHKAEGSLHKLGMMTASELKSLEKGLGDTKAATLLAAMELSRRRLSEQPLEQIAVRSSRDAYEALFPHLSDLQHEEFYALALNRANKILSVKRMSMGGITGTVADIRIIMRFALDLHATGMVIAHNHPSGNTEPSQADLDLTSKVNAACKIFEFTLIDHLIIGRNKYFSFADHGKL